MEKKDEDFPQCVELWDRIPWYKIFPIFNSFEWEGEYPIDDLRSMGILWNAASKIRDDKYFTLARIINKETKDSPEETLFWFPVSSSKTKEGVSLLAKTHSGALLFNLTF